MKLSFNLTVGLTHHRSSCRDICRRRQQEEDVCICMDEKFRRLEKVKFVDVEAGKVLVVHRQDQPRLPALFTCTSPITLS